MADTKKSFTQIFSSNSAVNSHGRFEVDTISAGSGNGWRFSASVLQESLALWDNAGVLRRSFVDAVGT